MPHSILTVSRTLLPLLFAAVLSLVLSGCGGGGGGGGDTPPAAPVPTLGYGIKTLEFTWPAVSGATHYRLLENPDGASGFVQIGSDITGTSVSHAIALYRRVNARYMVAACNSIGCTDSATIALAANLIPAIGYVKASNTGESDGFGTALALSADGNTLAVGAHLEDSNATDLGGNQTDNTAPDSGAVYIYTRGGGTWIQQAYVKASNTGADDRFGTALALSADGNTLAVGAHLEDSNATGQADNSASDSGAVYIFTRSASTWTQQAYVKASNTEANDVFGIALALSADGNTLAVGATGEASNNATDQANNSASGSGAVYIFTRSGSTWTQQAYVKASNIEADDFFGSSLALSADGNTLAVGAFLEDSSATDVGGEQTDNTATDSGAVYIYTRSGSTWTQQAYVKASNTETGDYFGFALALAADGNTLAVGAVSEDSNAIGIGSINQGDNSTSASGAVYIYTRSGSTWTQQTYVKASNTGANDRFGTSLALSADGNTLAVGAMGEASNATGIGGDQAYDVLISGAVYMYTRSSNIWAQQAYVKASNTGSDSFGFALALAADSNTLAVGARAEDSSATGIGGNQTDNTATDSGAVYLY